jgi:hypothetical protein
VASSRVRSLLLRTFVYLCEWEKSVAPIKAAGKYRLEGGKYVVQMKILFISSLVSCDS